MGRDTTSLQDLITLVGDLRCAGVGFRFLHEALDTTTLGGRLVFHVFATLAEFICELIVEGVHEGLDSARAFGKHLGRLPTTTEEQIRHARDLMQLVVSEDLPAYDRGVAAAAGYTTPKIDVRSGVFDPIGRVLLVREVSDKHRWTLPGGWCDILESPRQAVEREVLEEAGLPVRVVHLAGVIDRHLWPHAPTYDRHIYKLFFVYEPLADLDTSFSSAETSEVAWFDMDGLPELSVSRVLPEQIALLHKHWAAPGPAYVD